MSLLDSIKCIFKTASAVTCVISEASFNAVKMSSVNVRKKYKNDKQFQAVMSNIKEQQNLDNVYNTLRLEESHALKLLRVDYIQAQTRQRRMENRISKIRSYLSADDIAAMKLLESQGKLCFKQEHTLNSTLKIAAAAQRLKLRPSQTSSASPTRLTRRCSVIEAPTKVLQPGTTQASFLVRIKTVSSSNGNLLRRSSSLSTPRPDNRRNSVHFGGSGDDVQTLDARTSRSSERRTQRVSPNNNEDRLQLLGKARSMTANGYCTDNQLTTTSGKRRPKTATVDSYSSHDMQNFSLDGSSPSTKRGALLPTSIADAKARERADDLRQELLLKEQLIGEHLESRRREFLLKTTAWVEDNPAFVPFDPIEAARERKLVNGLLHSGTNSEIDETDGYVGTINDVWKDLKKCRYLRIQDNQVDMSGIKTMASEQINLYQTLAKTRIT